MTGRQLNLRDELKLEYDRGFKAGKKEAGQQANKAASTKATNAVKKLHKKEIADMKQTALEAARSLVESFDLYDEFGYY